MTITDKQMMEEWKNIKTYKATDINKYNELHTAFVTKYKKELWNLYVQNSINVEDDYK